MIPTITDYLYELHRNKSRMEHEAEKQKALRYVIGIIVCVAVALSIFLRA